MIAREACLYWKLKCLEWDKLLQNRMALDIITASQEGTDYIIQTECCAFIFDEFANVSSFLNHMRTLINALSDLTL